MCSDPAPADVPTRRTVHPVTRHHTARARLATRRAAGENATRGLTLLELIIVIVILGILSAITIPTFLSIINNSKAASYEATLVSVHTDALGICAVSNAGNETITDTCLSQALAETGTATGSGLLADGSHYTLMSPDGTPAPAGYVGVDYQTYNGAAVVELAVLEASGTTAVHVLGDVSNSTIIAQWTTAPVSGPAADPGAPPPGSSSPSSTTTTTTTTAPTSTTTTTTPSSGPTAYVADAYATSGSSSIAVINTASNTVTDQIPVSGNPTTEVVSPDGSTLYVGLLSGSIDVINTATNSITHTINLGASGLLSMAISPDGSTIYASQGYYGSNLYVISTASDAVTNTYSFDGSTITSDGSVLPSDVYNLVVSPDNSTLYMTDGNCDVDSFNLITQKVTGSPSGIDCGNGIALSSDGSTIYAPTTNTQISVLNTTDMSISSDLTISGIPSGETLQDTPPVVSGSTLYLPYAGYKSGDVYAVSTTTGAVTGDVADSDGPSGLALIPSGSDLYAYNSQSPGASSVTDINVASFTATATFAADPSGAGAFPAALAIGS